MISAKPHPARVVLQPEDGTEIIQLDRLKALVEKTGAGMAWWSFDLEEYEGLDLTDPAEKVLVVDLE